MKRWIYGLLVIPCLMMVMIFLIFPLITMIYPTFFEGTFTFARYVSFLADEYYRGILWRSVKLSLITTLICVVMGLPTAYYMSTRQKKIKGLLAALILFPLLTNSVIRGFAWITILGRNGVINTVLTGAKIIDTPISMLYTEFAIVVGSVYLFLPLMITTLTAVMDQMEPDAVEAAQSLGANSLQVFVKVIFPLTLSGLIVGSVLVFSGVMSAYTTPSLLGGNRNMMMATLLYQQASTQSNWLGASVVSLIMILTTVLLMRAMNVIAAKVDRRGVQHG